MVISLRVRAALALVGLFYVGCKPKVAGRASLIDSETVLAVSSTPAEAKPGEEVQYTALYGGPDGALDASALEWALCSARKPLALPGPIAPNCLRERDGALAPLGSGESAMATVPKDVCRTFGPLAPPVMMGQPGQRPADPDTTGGYYQPVRLLAPDPATQSKDAPTFAVGVTRLACGLSGATQEQSAQYAKRYRANENPALESLELRRKGGTETLSPQSEGGEAARVKPGEQVVLRARWAGCPLEAECGDAICGPGEDKASCADDCGEPRGCTGSEPYVVLDPVRRELADVREAIRVSWFVTDGEFEHDRTGRTEEAAGTTSSDNPWTAPLEQGPVHLWVVIRDDRGGVGFQRYALQVAR